ncbi:MAG: hypothetical protein L0206_25435 [Actinobacteria bacterium]|nr:hypothetical protein [Actinomycetota bacterium]
MTIEQFRKAFEAQPFAPFILHLADGREIPVRSREFMTGAPGGRTFTIYQPAGQRNVIDLLLVTDLEFESSARGGTSEVSPP